MVAGIQGSRMNDQRASLPQFPGLNSQAVINQYLRQRNVQDVPDDNFFEMLMRSQVCELYSLVFSSFSHLTHVRKQSVTCEVRRIALVKPRLLVRWTGCCENFLSLAYLVYRSYQISRVCVLLHCPAFSWPSHLTHVRK